jgi:hypothetical protein
MVRSKQVEHFVHYEMVSKLLGGSVRTTKTRRSIDGLCRATSTKESGLIEQLIKFDDFSESESDDKDERGTCKKLQETCLANLDKSWAQSTN